MSRTAFESFFQLEWDGAARALSMVLGSPVQVAISEIDPLEDLGGWLATLPGDIWMAIGEYTQGPQNPRTLLVSANSLKPLADLMLGGDTSANQASDASLTDLQLGALGEAVNQLFSGAAQQLSNASHAPVEVSNPILTALDAEVLDATLPTPIERVTLTLTIQAETPLSLPLYWLTHTRDVETLSAALASPPDPPSPLAPSDTTPMSDADLMSSLGIVFPEEPQPAADLAGVTAGIASGKAPRPASPAAGDPVSVRPVQFSSFDNQMSTLGEEHQNLGLLLDVQLNLSVELGKTELPIRDVLALTRGSVIELERIAGEPVDLLANGRLVAKGEVVVIEDHFGLRITNILSPAERLQGL